jgi:hypothetical protein
MMVILHPTFLDSFHLAQGAAEPPPGPLGVVQLPQTRFACIAAYVKLGFVLLLQLVHFFYDGYFTSNFLRQSNSSATFSFKYTVKIVITLSHYYNLTLPLLF